MKFRQDFNIAVLLILFSQVFFLVGSELVPGCSRAGSITYVSPQIPDKITFLRKNVLIIVYSDDIDVGTTIKKYLKDPVVCGQLSTALNIVPEKRGDFVKIKLAHDSGMFSLLTKERHREYVVFAIGKNATYEVLTHLNRLNAPIRWFYSIQR